MTLVEFLLARIAEDEAVARAAGATNGGGLGWAASGGSVQKDVDEDSWGEIVVYDEGSPSDEEAEHIARHDPARVLAECEAKRQIVQVASWCDNSVNAITKALRHPAGQTILRALALPYADHPDYQEEWRP